MFSFALFETMKDKLIFRGVAQLLQYFSNYYIRYVKIRVYNRTTLVRPVMIADFWIVVKLTYAVHHSTTLGLFKAYDLFITQTLITVCKYELNVDKLGRFYPSPCND